MSVFDLLAKEWDLNSNRVKNAKSFANTLKKIVPIKDKKIIDYGAGTGLVTFSLCDEACEVLALDNSNGMLEELEKKVKSADISNVKTSFHDIETQDLPSGYDLFVSAMTMHHISDTDMFLSKAKDSLKKGGYVAISDLVCEDGSFHSRGNDGVYHFGFDRDEIKKIYQKHGLKVIFDDIIEVIKKDKEYPVFLIVGKYE